ncbi:helix-turn-helix domain-containing protein [Streptococcus suis]|uniref:helix-turn-helix domain-containing protein n=1 Tax=Streptococcus suis TaxID=1307 RepID=UPI0004009743|nr:helix-turn-helix transcriptional regulator [Streptococcus suis]
MEKERGADLNNRVNLLRKQKKKTMKQLALETGIGLSTISNYENGYSTPKKDNAKKLADYFGVSIPYLLGLDDIPQLRDPGKEGLLKGIYQILKDGTTISDKIDDWTPFQEDVAVMLADFRDSKILEDYIDFIAKSKDYNPVIVKAYKQYLRNDDQYFAYLINRSGAKDSPYHYVWQAWEASDEYKRRIAEKQKKKD